MRPYLLACLCFLPLLLCGQPKFERESRIRSEEVPEAAQQFLAAGQIDARVKWYFEENFAENSVEAKFCRDKQRFSVEFDTSGMIQDIEVQIKVVELPPTVLKAVENQLAALFSRYRIRKTQVQYSGSEEVLNSVLSNYPDGGEALVQYEMVIKGRDAEETALYEFTFDQSGRQLKQRRIIFKNANHLEY